MRALMANKLVFRATVAMRSVIPLIWRREQGMRVKSLLQCAVRHVNRLRPLALNAGPHRSERRAGMGS